MNECAAKARISGLMFPRGGQPCADLAADYQALVATKQKLVINVFYKFIKENV